MPLLCLNSPLCNIVKMKLSPRAFAYLNSLGRNSDWVTNEKETRDYLKNVCDSNSDQLLSTQLNFSGYELRINNFRKSSFEIHFISKYHIEKHKKIYSERIKNEVIFSFKNDNGLDNYFITNTGKICTKDEDHVRVIHFTFDKIETKIEQYALLNEFFYFETVHFLNLHVIDYEKLKNELSDFDLIPECSDSLNFCCKNHQAIFLTSPWHGSSGHYLTIYAIDKSFGQKTLSRLKKKNLIK